MTVREGQSRVCVHVPSTLVQKILLNTPPDKLNKTVGTACENTNKPILSCSSISFSNSISLVSQCYFYPTAPASEERFVQVVAKRIHSILSAPRSMFHLTIRSHFESDENSIPVIQNFLLLDFAAQEA